MLYQLSYSRSRSAPHEVYRMARLSWFVIVTEWPFATRARSGRPVRLNATANRCQQQQPLRAVQT